VIIDVTPEWSPEPVVVDITATAVKACEDWVARQRLLGRSPTVDDLIDAIRHREAT